MNGCHSQIAPNRLQSELIYHSKGNESWENVMTRTCQDDNKLNDIGCIDCKEVIKQHCQCPACINGIIHDSDCAVHNEPAYPNGKCNCRISDDGCREKEKK